MLMAHDLIDEIHTVKDLDSLEYLDLLLKYSEEDAQKYIEARSWGNVLIDGDKEGSQIFKSHGDYELWVGEYRAFLLYTPNNLYSAASIAKLINYMRHLSGQEYHSIWNDLWLHHYENGHSDTLSSYEQAIEAERYITNFDDIRDILSNISGAKKVPEKNDNVCSIIIDKDGCVWYTRMFGNTLDNRQAIFHRIDIEKE